MASSSRLKSSLFYLLFVVCRCMIKISVDDVFVTLLFCSLSVFLLVVVFVRVFCRVVYFMLVGLLLQLTVESTRLERV